jgi:RNase adaptor protein for sRNA GlmZ degradation
MTPNILLVAGLPGSGKTTYLCELEGRGWLCFDDFKNAAINNSRQFRQSPHCATLLTRLREGVRCVVTDIDFCHTESRREATDVLRAEVSSVDIRWLYFSHNVEDCAANIIRRARRSLPEDLKELSRYSACYQIPYGAQERPCYRRASGEDERGVRLPPQSTGRYPL